MESTGSWGETTARTIVDVLVEGEGIDVKKIGHTLVDQLSDDATLKDFSDVCYREYVRFKIALGQRASAGGRVVAHEEVKRSFLHSGSEPDAEQEAEEQAEDGSDVDDQ